MTEKEQAWISVPEDLGVYQVGDRVPWCEGCYGSIVAKIGGTLAIRTDDGVDRMSSEEQTLKVEEALQHASINWG